MTDLIHRVLLGRYRVDEFIGHGGMADVYRVYDKQRATVLAIKVLRPELANESHLFERFSQEAKLLAALSHPHIVRFYEWQQTDEAVFIVMDYVAGSNLRQVIRERNRPLSLSAILEFYRPIASALFYAHQNAAFHCDMKPSNILIDSGRQEVYVSDFGVARIAGGPAALGTPTHMAPEQVEGGAIDARTDIYGLGVMLFELATGGKRPFNGDSPRASGATPEERLAWEQVHQPPPPPSQFNPSIPPGLEDVILRALSKEPKDRFDSTATLLQALESVLAQQPPSSPASNLLDTFAGTIKKSISAAQSWSPAQSNTPRTPPITRRTPPPTKPAPSMTPGPAPQSQRGAKVYLLVRSGEQTGQWFPVGIDPWLIGRGREAHLSLASTRVSRRHASIHKGKGYYYIQDLQSTHGTFVNGRPVTAPRALRTGDIIRIGDVDLEFREAK